MTFEYLYRLLPLTLVEQIGPAAAVMRTLPAEEGWELQNADGRPFARDEGKQLAVFRYRRQLSEAKEPDVQVDAPVYGTYLGWGKIR